MSENSDAALTGPSASLDDLNPGDQALVSLAGRKFDYGRLPESAFGNLLVLSVGRNPGKIQRALEAEGANPRSVGVVPVSGSSIDYDGPMWVADRVSPMDFTGISIQFTRAFQHSKPDEGWVLVDSVSILLMYADVDRVYRLLDSIVGACRSKNVRGVFVIDRNAVTDETANRLSGLVDTVLE
jgi:hypothetical protein